MKLPAIIVSDPHFTANPNDEYRWGLWPWLASELKAEKARTLLILGDLTDAKDLHPAELVNRLTAAIVSMPVEEIIVLAGNHDWLKQGGVFFEFLKHIQKPKITVITKPTQDWDMDDKNPLCMFLPYSKKPARDWQGMDFSHFDYLFLHQTAPGSVASNGQMMDGDELPELNAGKVYSGDIHVPQVIGQIEYVGSPYHVHFGDNFKPRCIVIDRNRKSFDLEFEAVSRRAITIKSIEDLRKVGIRAGDQVKLKIEMHQADAHQWAMVRTGAVQHIKDIGAHLHGCKLSIIKSTASLYNPTKGQLKKDFSAAMALHRYVTGQELGGDILDAGLEIVER